MTKRVRGHVPLSPEALDFVAARFRALGDPSRLRVLNALLSGEHSVQELMDASGLSQTATSRQLGVLRSARIVDRRTEGKNAIYRVVDPSVAELCRTVCAGLEQRLADDLRVIARPDRPVAGPASRAARRRRH
jgi:DNA-binding transcriptional ArsR family regulator